MSLAQMTAETLDTIRGVPMSSPHLLSYVAKLDPSVSVRVPRGSCLHLSPTTGKLLLGVGNAFSMPLFNFDASDEADVTNAAGGNPATDKGAFVPVNPTGNINCLLPGGAYELISTNYYTGVTYAPNDPLTSPLTTGAGVNAGQLNKGLWKTNTIVGVVSRGVIDNGSGNNALAFWPWFGPA